MDILSPEEMHLTSAENFLSGLNFVFIVCSRLLDIKDLLHKEHMNKEPYFQFLCNFARLYNVLMQAVFSSRE